MKKWMGAGLVCALAMTSCGGGKIEGTKSIEVTQISGTALPDEVNGGTITGKVSFEGAKPEAKIIDMSANPACARAHANSPQKSEDLVVNANGTLKYAFVWVKSGLAPQGWAIPAKTVGIDQSGCMYEPHVVGVMVGQNLEIKNSDPTNHNTQGTPTVNAIWNESQTPGGDARSKTFLKQEVMIPLKCNIHPWMRAYVGVVSNPFFAVTGEDGTFTLKGLPPGTYTVQVWHEKFPPQEMTVTVGAKDVKTADFSFKG
jgi:plastocyanin